MTKVIKADRDKIEISKDLYEIFNRIIDTKDRRFFLHHVHRDLEKNTMVVTDGRILYLYDYTGKDLSENTAKNLTPAKIGKQFYLVNKSDEDSGEYPNYERVIPEYDGPGYCRIENDKIGGYDFNICGKSCEDSMTTYMLYKGIDSPIDRKYLSLLKYESNFKCHVTGENNKAVVMECDESIFVVMPIMKD